MNRKARRTVDRQFHNKPRRSKTPCCPRCRDAGFVLGEQVVVGKTVTTQWTCRSCLLTWPEARMAKADVKRR